MGDIANLIEEQQNMHQGTLGYYLGILKQNGSPLAVSELEDRIYWDEIKSYQDVARDFVFDVIECPDSYQLKTRIRTRNDRWIHVDEHGNLQLKPCPAKGTVFSIQSVLSEEEAAGVIPSSLLNRPLKIMAVDPDMEDRQVSLAKHCDEDLGSTTPTVLNAVGAGGHKEAKVECPEGSALAGFTQIYANRTAGRGKTKYRLKQLKDFKCRNFNDNNIILLNGSYGEDKGDGIVTRTGECNNGHIEGIQYYGREYGNIEKEELSGDLHGILGLCKDGTKVGIDFNGYKFTKDTDGKEYKCGNNQYIKGLKMWTGDEKAVEKVQPICTSENVITKINQSCNICNSGLIKELHHAKFQTKNEEEQNIQEIVGMRRDIQCVDKDKFEIIPQENGNYVFKRYAENEYIAIDVTKYKFHKETVYFSQKPMQFTAMKTNTEPVSYIFKVNLLGKSYYLGTANMMNIERAIEFKKYSFTPSDSSNAIDYSLFPEFTEKYPVAVTGISDETAMEMTSLQWYLSPCLQDELKDSLQAKFDAAISAKQQQEMRMQRERFKYYNVQITPIAENETKTLAMTKSFGDNTIAFRLLVKQSPTERFLSSYTVFNWNNNCENREQQPTPGIDWWKQNPEGPIIEGFDSGEDIPAINWNKILFNKANAKECGGIYMKQAHENISLTPEYAYIPSTTEKRIKLNSIRDPLRKTDSMTYEEFIRKAKELAHEYNSEAFYLKAVQNTEEAHFLIECEEHPQGLIIRAGKLYHRPHVFEPENDKLHPYIPTPDFKTASKTRSALMHHLRKYMFQYLVAITVIGLWVYSYFTTNERTPIDLTVYWVLLMILLSLIDKLTNLGSLTTLNAQFAKIILGENKE